MLRSRGENLRSIYILLFLNASFFILEYQDPQKYAALFAFDRYSVAGGQWWRVLTYQFTQSGQGSLFGWKPLILFFTMLLLYLMGSAIEEEWGTNHFLMLFALSTAGSAVAAAVLNIPLMGSYFVNFSLLFIYAAAFPDQVFLLFAVLPIRVRLLAAVAAVMLTIGALFGSPANLAALTGAVLSFAYFSWLRRPYRVRIPIDEVAPIAPVVDSGAMNNATRFTAVKRAIEAASAVELDALQLQFEREIVKGVNICPPADYKPEAADGYCLRCEGFAECSARHIRLNR